MAKIRSIIKAAQRAKDAAKKANLGTAPTARPGRVRNRTREQGGYTVQPKSGEVPETGLMMGMFGNEDMFTSGPYKGISKNTVLDKDLTAPDVEEFYGRHASRFNDPNTYAGAWKDMETSKTYMDVSKRFDPDDIRKATKFGERTGQIAGYDIGKGEEFAVGSWDDFIQSSDFFKRMDEMEAKGKDYLAQHPTDEWWDIHGTSMADVYGPENVDRLSGYIATTAPNTAPTENMQVASEYMRRYLRGEPIVQPGYSVPATAMSRKPGGKLGMEAGRRRNLAKSTMGQIDRLRSDKVRSEAQALSGDPDAMVFDRWWARLAEDPKRGVFTGSEEGKIPVASQSYNPYGRMEEEIGAYARSKGRSPRDFTADVWTGVREQAKEGDLYGVPTNPGAVTGESKGYADIFTDLVNQKAKHLGISVDELKKRLRAGKEELLGVGAVPAGLMIPTEEDQGI